MKFVTYRNTPKSFFRQIRGAMQSLSRQGQSHAPAGFALGLHCSPACSLSTKKTDSASNLMANGRGNLSGIEEDGRKVFVSKWNIAQTDFPIAPLDRY